MKVLGAILNNFLLGNTFFVVPHQQANIEDATCSGDIELAINERVIYKGLRDDMTSSIGWLTNQSAMHYCWLGHRETGRHG